MHNTPHKKLSPRKRIILFANEAFQTQGIKDVTMDEIARGLQMSKRTLYQVFTDKEELVMACIDHHRELEREFNEQIINQTDSALEILLLNLEFQLKIIQKCSPLYFSDLQRYQRVKEYLEECNAETIEYATAFFQKGVKQGYFLPDLDFKLIFDVLFMQFRFTLNHSEYAKYPLEHCFLNIALTTIRGCTTIKGLEQMDKFIEEYLKRS